MGATEPIPSQTSTWVSKSLTTVQKVVDLEVVLVVEVSKTPAANYLAYLFDDLISRWVQACLTS